MNALQIIGGVVLILVGLFLFFGVDGVLPSAIGGGCAAAGAVIAYSGIRPPK